jgi:hypothetical protein
MTQFENIQTVAFERDITSKVHFVKSLHGNLGTALIFCNVIFIFELEVMLNWLSWKLRFLIPPRGEGRRQCPVSCQDRESGDQGEENKCLDSASYFSGQIKWHNHKCTNQDLVAESLTTRAFGREWGIANRRVLMSVSIVRYNPIRPNRRMIPL